MLEPNASVDHVKAMDDSVAVIESLLDKDRTKVEDVQLRANAEHLLIMSERLGVDGYTEIANRALGALVE